MRKLLKVAPLRGETEQNALEFFVINNGLGLGDVNSQNHGCPLT